MPSKSDLMPKKALQSTMLMLPHRFHSLNFPWCSVTTAVSKAKYFKWFNFIPYQKTDSEILKLLKIKLSGCTAIKHQKINFGVF